MKIIGTLDVKDDGDILCDVLDHLPPFDAIFAYNDGSTDNTEDILRGHRCITKYVNREDFPQEIHDQIPQHRRHHLLKMVMDEFKTYNTESIWVVRLEGDRYFMNTGPWEMCHKAEFHELSGVAGVMVDCRIGPHDDWSKLDSYPIWHKPLPILQNWGRIDDVHPVVAFKVEDGVQYSIKKPRPWPVVWGPTDYHANDIVTDKMAFFAHHGRRGPRYWSRAYREGGFRTRSVKWPSSWDFASPQRADATVHGLPFRPDNLLNPMTRLRSVASEYEYGLGHNPYGGEYLQNDLANLITIWNNMPERRR